MTSSQSYSGTTPEWRFGQQDKRIAATDMRAVPVLTGKGPAPLRIEGRGLCYRLS